jgi:hypothetical protein
MCCPSKRMTMAASLGWISPPLSTHTWYSIPCSHCSPSCSFNLQQIIRPASLPRHHTFSLKYRAHNSVSMALRGQCHSVPLIDDKGLLARHISTVAPTVRAPRTHSQPCQQRYDAQPLDDKGTKYNIAKARGTIHKTPLQIHVVEARGATTKFPLQISIPRMQDAHQIQSYITDTRCAKSSPAYTHTAGIKGAQMQPTRSCCPPSRFPRHSPSPTVHTCKHVPFKARLTRMSCGTMSTLHTPGGWHCKALASLTGTDPLTSQ